MNAVRRLTRHAEKRISQAWSRVYRRLVPRSVAPGYSPGPLEIAIQLTFRCNLRCSFCGQWRKTGIFKSHPADQLGQSLSLPVLQRVIDELPLSCRGVYLWGGEPLMYRDIVPLVRYIKKSRRRCSLTTNGSLLANSARALVEAGVDHIDVSLSAGEHTTDQLRGQNGTFQAAIDGIRVLREERGVRASGRPAIFVSAILLPAAAAEFRDLVQQLKTLGVDRVWVAKQQYTSEQQGGHHERVFQQLFQITPTSWKGFVGRPEIGSAEKIRALVEELRADPSNDGFLQWETPSWGPTDFLSYYENPTFTTPGDRTCRFPWNSASILPNGDVSPCPDFPDFVVGNVKETPFSGIWHSSQFAQFRKSLAERGRFPVCTSCCHLYDG